MLKTHHAQYTFDATQHRDTTWLVAERTTAVSTFAVTTATVDVSASTHRLNVPLTSLAQFSRLESLPNQAEPLRVWAKTMETAARRGIAATTLGALVGLVTALPLWPFILTGGVVTGLVGGVCQYGPLQRTSRVDLLVTHLANIAREAEGGSPRRLERLQQEVHRTSERFDDTGMPGLMLCGMLFDLLDAARMEAGGAVG